MYRCEYHPVILLSWVCAFGLLSQKITLKPRAELLTKMTPFLVPDRSSEVRTYLLLSFLSNGYDIPFHTSKPNETLPYSMQLRFWIEYMRKKIRKDTLLMKKM